MFGELIRLSEPVGAYCLPRENGKLSDLCQGQLEERLFMQEGEGEGWVFILHIYLLDLR
jgi:hypothetical protein